MKKEVSYKILYIIDKALKLIYEKDQFIINNIESTYFRLGLYLNDLLKSDFEYKNYYVDYVNNEIIISNRNSNEKLLVIKLLKDNNKIINPINNTLLEIIIVLKNSYYQIYNYSSNYYMVEEFE